MKNVLVYTLGVSSEGGGGRRVYMELCQNFSDNKILATSWSIFPIFPENLYDGRYSFKTEFFYENFDFSRKQLESNKKEIRACFLEAVNSHNVGYILFDTEYSYLEFIELIGPLPSNSEVKLAALIHDQVWKVDPGYIKFLRKGLNSNFTTYNKVVKSFDEIRKKHNLVFRKINIATISKKLLKSILFKNKAFINKRKSALSHLDLMFSLTSRSAKESEVLYEMSGRSHVAFGSEFSFEIDDIFLSNLEKKYSDKLRMLSFSRISPEKNIDIIISIFNQLKTRGHDSYLLIGGMVSDQKYYHYLKNLVNFYKLEKNVFFLGKVDDAEMNALYKFANAFICCDVCDFNLSTYKALSFGKPIAVSGGYDFPEDVKSMQGVYDNNFTVDDYVNSLEKIISKSSHIDRGEILKYDFNFYAQEILNKMTINGRKDN